jgi:hypothetical protein
MHDAVSVFGEKAQKLAPSHQFARGGEDNREAEVAFVAFDFDAEEVKNGMIFSTQWKYTKQSNVLASFTLFQYKMSLKRGTDSNTR